MVEHQSKEVVDKISDELKIQPALLLPREIAKQIQLTYNVNPLRPSTILRSTALTSTGVGTIFTTPSDRDFFLTAATMSIQCDSTATTTAYSMKMFVEGVSKALISISKITLTTTSKELAICLKFPLKLDRGTTITLNQTFGAGVSVMSGTITGYVTDPQ
jgi:hypothetical protein